MVRHPLRVLPLLLLGCVPEGEDAETTRFGHDGLQGEEWSGEAGGGDERGLTFRAAEVTVSNTCQQGDLELRAEVSVPVSYAYSVKVANDAAAGTVACGLTLPAGRYEVLILDGAIRIFAGLDVFELGRLGTTNGLFGTWAAPTADAGTLTWTFAANALRITRTCPGVTSEPVVLTVAATTTSFIELLEDATHTERDGDFECEVTAREARLSYVLDGDTLEVTEDGDTLTLTR